MKTMLLALSLALMSTATYAETPRDVTEVARAALDAEATGFDRGTIVSREAGVPSEALVLIVPEGVRQASIYRELQKIVSVKVGKHGQIEIVGLRAEDDKVAAIFTPAGKLERFTKVKPQREKGQPRKRAE